jgi:hypothetical protein
MSETKTARRPKVDATVMIGDKFRIRLEDMNRVLEHLRITEAGEEVWEVEGYFSTVEQSLKTILYKTNQEKVAKKTKVSLEEYIQLSKESWNEIKKLCGGLV